MPHRFLSGLALAVALIIAPACGDQPAPTASKVIRDDAPPSVEAKVAPAWTAETPIGQIVAAVPATVRIFELMKIDYCCGGERPLATAAEEQSVDVDALLAALAVVGTQSGPAAGPLWNERPLTELVDHIVSTHHVFLRRELPRLAEIIATVTEVHGESHPELAEVQATFQALQAELTPHLRHEEDIIFPAIRKLDQEAPTEALLTALRRMRHEHDGAGAALHTLRRLTGDYTPPADACSLFKEMLRGLLALEEDTLRHVHLENNVLLPRCLAAR